MKNMNIKKREKVLIAMDTISRCISNLDLYDDWRTCGIDEQAVIQGKLFDLSYMQDDVFSDMMYYFMLYMSEVLKNGGLECDGVSSD